MKLRWIIPLVALVLAIIAVPQGSVDADDEPEEEDFEIDGISYIVNGEGTVSANQCFNTGKDIIIPPEVQNKGRSYEVVTIATTFICYEPERISVPSTVTLIEDGAFSCPTLKEINVDEHNLVYSSIVGVLFDKNATLLIKYPSAKEGTGFIIPASVSTLANFCFADAVSLVTLWIPNTIYIIPNNAFLNCSALAYVNAGTSGNALPSSVRMIATGAFEGCVSLTDLEMPEGLVYIEEEAFVGSGLRTFTVNPFIKYIGEGAFASCPNLESFSGSNGTYEARDGILYEVKASDTKLHTYPANRPDEVFEVQRGTTSLARMAFSGANNLKEVVLPSTLSTISNVAFFNCNTLERMSLPDSILEIGNSAFQNCRNLRDVVLNDGLVRIDDWAFAYCGMEHLTVPASVRHVGDEAFTGCSSLASVDFMSDYLTISGDVFCQCTSMTEINLYGPDVRLSTFTFSLMENEELAIININKSIELPEYLDDYHSNIEVKVIGERPYPMENLIGVAVCLLILIGIIHFFRKVRRGFPSCGMPTAHFHATALSHPVRDDEGGQGASSYDASMRSDAVAPLA